MFCCFNVYPRLAFWKLRDNGPRVSWHSPVALCLPLCQFSEPCIGKIDSGMVFSLVTSIFLMSIVFLHCSVLIRTGGQGLETLKQTCTVLDLKDRGTEKYFHVAGVSLQRVNCVLLYIVTVHQ
jgi:hypothetical protein